MLDQPPLCHTMHPGLRGVRDETYSLRIPMRRIPMRRIPMRRPRSGFTLIEMVVVVLLIGMVCAVAMPQFLPVIAMSEFEGAARHLAGYGRSAISRAILIGEPLTVTFDLDKQEYWTTRLVTGSGGLFDEETAEGEGELFQKRQYKDFKLEPSAPFGKSGDRQTSALLDFLAPADLEGQVVPDPLVDPKRLQFERYVKTQLVARAERIEKEGILSDIGPLFEKPFTLEDAEEQYEELKEPLLQRTKMPNEVRIHSIRIGATTHTSGLAEVELNSMGLDEPVTIYVRGEDDEYFTVLWDPIMCGAQIEPGKKEFEPGFDRKRNVKKPDKARNTSAARRTTR